MALASQTFAQRDIAEPRADQRQAERHHHEVEHEPSPQDAIGNGGKIRRRALGSEMEGA
jgi:hypothetical protein